MKAKKWIGIAAIASIILICISLYYMANPDPGYLEVVKAETDPLYTHNRKITVTLKWHGMNGTQLNFYCMGRDYVAIMAEDWSQTVNDGDEITVYMPVGWAWLEIRYGSKVVRLHQNGTID